MPHFSKEKYHRYRRKPKQGRTERRKKALTDIVLERRGRPSRSVRGEEMGTYQVSSWLLWLV